MSSTLRLNEGFRFGGDSAPATPPPPQPQSPSDGHIDNGRHDRNQSLPNVTHNHTVKVRPHRAATYSRAGPSTHAPLVPTKSSDRVPQIHSQTPAMTSQMPTTLPLGQYPVTVPSESFFDRKMGSPLTPTNTTPAQAESDIDSSPNRALQMGPSSSEQQQPVPSHRDDQVDQTAQLSTAEQVRSTSARGEAQVVASKTGEPKTPSEYALHILFTQVGHNQHPFEFNFLY